MESTINKYLWIANFPKVDLLIRSGGEKRISNFMLWKIANAYLYFSDIYWPDFDEKEIHEAIRNFNDGMKVNVTEQWH